MGLGLDGLSTETLRASRASFWDERFTQVLLDAIPQDVEQIVDLGCGLAKAAHALLPNLPRARYLGIDADSERLEEARSMLASSSLGERVALEHGWIEALPLQNGSADVVLSTMTLQHVADVPKVLGEARRVLRSHGRIVAAEPDNIGQRFYFDGGLDEVQRGFETLFETARASRRPADTALGPRLGRLVVAAGFADVSVRVHALHNAREVSAAAFFNRLRQVAEIAARSAGLAVDCDEARACHRAIDRALAAGEADRMGFGCQVSLVFLVSGHASPAA